MQARCDRCLKTAKVRAFKAGLRVTDANNQKYSRRLCASCQKIER